MSAQDLLPEGVLVLERGWLSSNNVMVRGTRQAALVDSGYCTHAPQTLRLVSQALGDRQLTTLANTHLHSDHCGGNAALQAAHPGLQTLIPPGQAAAVRNWDPVKLTYQPTGQQCPPFHIEGVLHPGSSVRLGDLSWQVHAAPGHDPHSVILFEPVSGALISADALWQNGFGVVFPELEGEHAFDEVAATLDLIESLAPKVIIPGHGAVFTGVEAALEHARSRLQAYVARPERHAAHAAKVLLKFKLLEWRKAPAEELVAWASETPYFSLIHERWAPEVPMRDWLDELLLGLVRSRAAALEGGFVIDT